MKKLISILLVLTTLAFSQDSTAGKLAVVLSGGGLRGTGHIGVLRALEEKKIKIDLIVGSSVGALIGGLYCAGYSLDEIENFLLKVNWEEIYNDSPNRSDLFYNQKNLKERAILEIRFSGSGAEIPKAFSSGQKLRSLITEKVLHAPFGNRQNFDQFRIPFRAVATNFINGNKTIFRKGDLAEVIHSSIAVPLLYEPVEIDSSLYVDGGLSDNLPIDVAHICGADFVIASDLTSPLRTRDKLNAPWEIADQVTGIMMQKHLAEKRSEANILIRPNLNKQTPGDWENIEETIQKSYITAIDTLNKYQKILNPYHLNRDKQYYHFGKFRIDKNIINNIHFKVMLLDSNYPEDSLAEDLQIHVDSLIHDVRNGMNTGNQITEYLINRNLPYIQTQYQLAKDTLFITLRNSKIREIHIKGNDNTKSMIIARELVLKPGGAITYKGLLKSYNNIYSTDLFQRVGMHLVPVNNSDEYDLEIKVKEKKSNLIQLGVRYDNTRYGKAFLEFSNQNIFGYGIQNYVFLEIGELDRGFKLDFNMDRLGYTKITTGADIHRTFHTKRRFVNDSDYVSYSDSRSGIGVFFGWQIERFGQVVLWGKLENLHSVYDSPLFKSNQYLFSKLQLSSIADRRNSRVYPQTGNYNLWSLELGHYESSTAKNEFIKFFIQLSEWYRLHKYHSLGILFQNGLADNNIPYEEFFEWGGANKMPGFIDREFAGRTMWLLRADYRFEIPIDFSGRYFFHLGVAAGKSSISSDNYLKFDNIVYGIVSGFSVKTFIGPVSLLYGYNDFHAERIYLNIGYPF